MRGPGGRRRLKLWHEALAIVLVAAAVVGGLYAFGWFDPNAYSQTMDAQAVATALTEVRTGRCPALPPPKQPTNVYGTGDVLEPVAADRLLLCGYAFSAVNGTRSVRLVSRLVTDARTIGDFRAALNALPEPPGGTWNCPEETGSAVVEIFTDGSHEVEVLQDMTGCQEATNGAREGWVGTSSVGMQVMRLLPPTYCADVWTTECGFLK